jgi:2-dehydro-3-deoxyglucarate aldolase/4-hydroxy-2-oxoheptanedioate aldolase
MSLSQRLRQETPYVGTLVTLASPEAADALAIAGLGWLFVDMEHSPVLDPTAVQRIVQAVAGKVDVLVRVPTNDDAWIKKVLDTGADGVIVPHVSSAEEALRAVNSAKYPPLGRRSVGITPAHGYGADFAGYVDRANESTALVVQIEDVAAVENLDEIVATPGVDAAFIGPYDLSGSMGRLGQIDDPEVQRAIERVVTGCATAGMPLGFFSTTIDGARQALHRGIRFLAVGTDVGLLMDAGRNIAASFE